MATYWDAISIAVIIGIVLMDLLPKIAKYATHGALLATFGVFPFLNEYGLLNFDIYSFPIVSFAALYIVMLAGPNLFNEGIKEENIVMKIISIVLGILIILITCIPWLQDFNAISFSLPNYSPVINFIIYIAASALLFAGLSKAKD